MQRLFTFFEKLTAAYPPADNAPPPDTLFAFMRYYARGFIKPILLVSALNALLAIFEVSLFSFMGQLVDWLASHDRETFLQQEGRNLLGMAMVLLIILPVLNGLAVLLNFQGLMGNFPMAVRWRAHRYLLGQSMEFYQDEFAGRIATKVMQTSLAVRETVLKLMEVLVYIAVYFITMLVVLVQINVWLMLPMLGWFVLYVFLQRYFVPRLKAVSQAQADARSMMTGRIVDAYTNIATVKLFAHTQREADYAKDSMDGFLKTVYQQMRLVSGLIFSVDLLNYLLIFAVATVGIILWLQDAVGTGAIAVGVAMALRLNGMAKWVMFEVSSLFENIGTATDGMNTLSQTQSVTDVNNAKPLTVTQGDIQFKAVDFSYVQTLKKSDSDEQRIVHVIKNLNLHIKAGERIGLVGRSGAGKSTLVNALLRFYDVQSGEILIDGQNIANIQQDSLREHIAMVTQDTSLLHRTVRENILYGKPDATEDELQTAIRQAKADTFIADLSDPQGGKGLDAKVGERGVKLSGGQRQRIAIARVLLKNAPILILDEATSALDSEVEAAIQESLIGLMHGKTVIAIAHRLSTIAAMDRLIVLDDGCIVEQGTHQELLDKNGVYAKLWAHQTGGFLGEE
ncbi:MAG: multidrug ABC transporter ATP-binding protein [Gammaproteobacteria bacterium]|nr:MAG: multidrug ABC transporter ATP-binding protein [Gammaproteobacteria bacterium]